ncbi:MAG: C40 family peptidase [Mycobacteriaceae bacterium]|nr:C40 family peptidase [Mycobacteriaceae bacterium]MBV9638436.1 C40 family peptidase [Mycobacteriaceae bacterium]
MVADSSGRPPPTPSGGGQLGSGATDAGQHYDQVRSSTAVLDGDAGSAGNDGHVVAQHGRAGTRAAVDTARAQAAAIAPATRSPGGLQLMVSAMDDRLAQMQRELDTAKAQNRLLALRLRQLALAYRQPRLLGMGAGVPVMPSPPANPSGAAPTVPVGGLEAPLRKAAQMLDGDTDGVAARAVAFAKTKLGRPYVWGGRGPEAYDCSGLICDAYAHAGVVLPRTTYDQIGCGVRVPRSDIRAGDLVFSNFSAPGRPEHVQLAVSSSEVIEAPTPGARVQFDSVPSGPIEIRRVA